jgi:ABC-type transport system involved in multi-copper enzyme maturation permease subunit
MATLLHYRPWRGQFQSPAHAIWPIARISLWMIFRRKLFWILYGFALLVFFMFFFGQYLLAWAQGQVGEDSVRVGFFRADPNWLIHTLRQALHINGEPEMYANFFWLQGYMVMIVLALSGSVLVGNDFHFGSLPFYLSKPLGRWHYLIGKCLAVAVFVNLLTTVPAYILYVQFGLLESWSYFTRGRLILGILAYGTVLTVSLSLMLVATASWLRRTVPMIMIWTTLFVFFRLLANTLVDRLGYSPHLRLIDLWNNAYLVGSGCLGVEQNNVDRQPPVFAALFVLGALSLLCLTYLNLRIRAVEIVK